MTACEHVAHGICRCPDSLQMRDGEWVHVFEGPDGVNYAAPCTSLDGVAFALFATVYPHEAYDSWPERFLAYAEQQSGKPREVILKILEETR